MDREDIMDALRIVIKEYLGEHKTPRTVLVTRAQAAERLGVDLSTLYRWEKDGYLPAVRIGRKVFYEEDLIRAMEEGKYLQY